VNGITRSPFFVFAVSLLLLWASAWAGALLRKRRDADEDVQKDLEIVVPAALTLLGLIIGFTFSMAISRYDQRKIYEEEEANAIGTEYLRAGLLPAEDATRVRALLVAYLNQRIAFYEAGDPDAVRTINEGTSRQQNELWSAVEKVALQNPTPVNALTLSGMNDVLNSQGYTQAAWWNRIPLAAWLLMLAIAICSNFLVGYDTIRRRMRLGPSFVLPFILSIAFFLIADIDSPRKGVIRVSPQNLLSLASSLAPPAQPSAR
jgi:hypothetical protein